MQMLFTSGILSFSTLLMFNIFAMLATVNEVLKHASLFTIPMSSVIISRFLLGLREVASSTVQHKLGTTNSSALRSRFSVQSAISSIGFASVVGNMGELLRSGDDDEDYDLTWSDAPYGTKIQQDVASVAEMQSVGLTPDFEMIHFDERPSKSP
ncbi:hypothetical protein OBBRIDRAFT_833296 [Obba rivulosa]|uniref:Uncharacterized protein n=1 Tax=Obba rivulosa TaxID=1052685 RepID=A0A8E2B2H7_9APHY|nr:hypothetical protein OBBRIDRAFT_833296 [Obba rivulosa]